MNGKYFRHLTETGYSEDTYTREELDALHEQGLLNNRTKIIDIRLSSKTGDLDDVIEMTYGSMSKYSVEYQPNVYSIQKDFLASSSTVIIGKNNSGKTLLLKRIAVEIGSTACYLGVNRFSHINELTLSRDSEAPDFYNTHLHNFLTSRQNDDGSSYNLTEIIKRLSNESRQEMLDTVSSLIGMRVSLHKTDVNNELSSSYIDIEGEDSRFSSTGTRLIFTFLAAMYDTRYKVLLLDEPEIGLDPRVQDKLSDIIHNKTSRSQKFKHLESIIIASHSHIFMNKWDVSTNYRCIRSGGIVSLSPLKSIQDCCDAQFDLLGGSLSNLYLPDKIVIVEGKTDKSYIDKLFSMLYPDKKVAVVTASGDGGIVSLARAIDALLGDSSISPYRKRIYILADSQNNIKMRGLLKSGIARDNVLELSKNGIEYYYPTIVLDKKFGTHDITITDSEVNIGGNKFSKARLSDTVLAAAFDRDSIDKELLDYLNIIVA